MHAVVTGASSGIGAALARELHATGARVTLVARRRALLERLAAELGQRAEVVSSDIAKDEWKTWLDAADQREPIDVFVNNAGINEAGPFASSKTELGRRTLEMDLLAPIGLARDVLPRMLARRSGVLVNVSSVAAWAPPAGMAWYAAAKAGLAAFSECLASELKGSGVRVLTVYPGPIDNGAPQTNYDLYGEGCAAARLPVGTAANLAREIRYAIARRKRRLVYPRLYAIARWMPAVARWAVDGGTPTLSRNALGAGGGDAARSTNRPAENVVVSTNAVEGVRND
jgi:short-subunit dehydrogenase